ncbi:gliding motility-associated C-terminal domain-containing protein, partial [Flavobacterium branchiophilum]
MGVQTPIITQAGVYNVSITDASGCIVQSNITITSTQCIIQKGISPNNDDQNDFFDLTGLNVKELGIFNRYGIKVYSRTNYKKEWFGQSDAGEELPDGA